MKGGTSSARAPTRTGPRDSFLGASRGLGHRGMKESRARYRSHSSSVDGRDKHLDAFSSQERAPSLTERLHRPLRRRRRHKRGSKGVEAGRELRHAGRLRAHGEVCDTSNRYIAPSRTLSTARSRVDGPDCHAHGVKDARRSKPVASAPAQSRTRARTGASLGENS